MTELSGPTDADIKRVTAPVSPPAVIDSAFTVPGKRWFTIFRLYGPLEGYMDGPWKPGDIESI
jgi:hypothetical protein